MPAGSTTRAVAVRLLRLLLPLCVLAATVVAVQGLFRVVGAPAGQPVSEESPSLRLGVGGGTDAAPAIAVPTQAPVARTTTALPQLTSPVVVINATGITGLAGRTADVLRRRGVRVASIGNLGAGQPPRRPTVFYPPGAIGQAQALASLCDAPAVAPAPGWMQSAGRLVLVITAASPLALS